MNRLLREIYASPCARTSLARDICALALFGEGTLESLSDHIGFSAFGDERHVERKVPWSENGACQRFSCFVSLRT